MLWALSQEARIYEILGSCKRTMLPFTTFALVLSARSVLAWRSTLPCAGASDTRTKNLRAQRAENDRV